MTMIFKLAILKSIVNAEMQFRVLAGKKDLSYTCG